MERYELVEGTSAKFWQFEVRGNDLVVEYGRLGSSGKTTLKSFDSPEAAGAAAAKLVKEKTGKGYSKVGNAAATPAAPEAAKAAKTPKAAKVAKAASAPAPAAPPAAAIGELPEWLTEPMLDELVAKLGKKSKRAPSDLADAVVGTDEGGTWGRMAYRSNAAIAILIDRGLWPEKLIPEVLREAVFGWAFMRPETLLGLIQRPDFDEALAEIALMRLGTAAPALLVPASDGKFPPKIALLAPLVRRRLGLSQEPLSDELADRLAAAFMRGSGSAGGQIERAGRCLVDRYFNSYAAYREHIVATFGISDWDERVARASAEAGFGTAWRAEPVFLSAPVAELAELLMNAGELDGETIFRWLESRKDDAADLCKVVKAMDPGEPIWGNRDAHQLREAVAVVAGARLAEAGEPILAELVGCLWFLDNLPPTRLNPAYTRALAKWPRAEVHTRIRELIQPPKEKEIESSDELPLGTPVRVAVGLGVHPDAALTRQLLDGLTWAHLHDAAAYVGRLGLEQLPDLLERKARDTAKREYDLAIQTLLVNAAETSGEPFATEHDVHFDPRKCHDKTAWQRAVALLPPARRDAYYLAWARLDPFELQPQLRLVSDETLDQIVGLMFSMRTAERVNVTYPKGVSFDAVGRTLEACGPRVVPMIEKHYRASRGDQKARELLAQMPLQPEAYAALAGTI